MAPANECALTAMNVTRSATEGTRERGEHDDRRDDILFLLTPHVSLFSVLSLYEVFRATNRLYGNQLYSLKFASLDGQLVECSNGITVQPHCRIDEVQRSQMLTVAASYEPLPAIRRSLISAIRRTGRHSSLLCGVDIGVMLLAESGLLDGYSVSVHWETLQSMRERFPAVRFNETDCTIDRHVLTCGGHISGVELALSVVRKQYGAEIALSAERELLYPRSRNIDNPLVNFLDPLSQNHKLRKLHDIMDKAIEEPIAIDIVADGVGVSRRQLEYLTQKYLGLSPNRYYLKLRLSRSREMLMYSNLPVSEIALLTGFTSATVFSRAFRSEYSVTPREYRTRFRVAFERPSSRNLVAREIEVKN
jgi:transcriptional regulator GlxA family with amidase domain